MEWANENTKTTGIFNDMRKEIEKGILECKKGAEDMVSLLEQTTDTTELKLLADTYKAFSYQVSNNITLYLLVMQTTSRSAEIPKDVQNAIIDIQNAFAKIKNAIIEMTKENIKNAFVKLNLGDEANEELQKLFDSIGAKEAKKNE